MSSKEERSPGNSRIYSPGFIPSWIPDEIFVFGNLNVELTKTLFGYFFYRIEYYTIGRCIWKKSIRTAVIWMPCMSM
jgi:hypothetical protein